MASVCQLPSSVAFQAKVMPLRPANLLVTSVQVSPLVDARDATSIAMSTAPPEPPVTSTARWRAMLEMPGLPSALVGPKLPSAPLFPNRMLAPLVRNPLLAASLTMRPPLPDSLTFSPVVV